MLLQPGKLYKVSEGSIPLLPLDLFKSTLSVDFELWEKVIYVGKHTKPNAFVSVGIVLDYYGVTYYKILYNKDFYIIQNDYHLGEKVQILI